MLTASRSFRDYAGLGVALLSLAGCGAYAEIAKLRQQIADFGRQMIEIQRDADARVARVESEAAEKVTEIQAGAEQSQRLLNDEVVKIRAEAASQIQALQDAKAEVEKKLAAVEEKLREKQTGIRRLTQ
jgi:hypothetical protein